MWRVREAEEVGASPGFWPQRQGRREWTEIGKSVGPAGFRGDQEVGFDHVEAEMSRGTPERMAARCEGLCYAEELGLDITSWQQPACDLRWSSGSDLRGGIFGSQ